jgi:phenylalanyl-tRNA synthetase beta chain
MPSVVLNKKEVEKILGKKISIEELKDRISMLGTDLDKIENDEIHVEIFPNRPDLMSEQGLGRALSSFLGIKTGLKEYEVKKSGYQLFAKDPEDNWPFVLGFIVKNLKLNENKIKEIIQLQEKLGTTLTRNRRKAGVGIYPLDKIKFPITFTGKPPTSIKFQPLDFKKELTAKQILEQHPKGKTYGYIMNSWKKYPLFIDANQIIMSMPPIINSELVGKITENSTDLFVESSGPDLNTSRDTLNIIATTLADMGGEIYSLEIVYPKKKFDFPTLEPKEMKLELDQVNKYLGLELTEKELKIYLERMGYSYNNKLVLIPAYRVDILNQVDLIEDVAISYGYEKFKPTIPQVSTIGQEDKFEILKTRIANYLVGFGLLETNSYNLISKADLKKTLVDIKTIQIKIL